MPNNLNQVCAAIYTRYSTEKQQSTEMQIDRCTDFAEKNNIKVVNVYSDEGRSGTNTMRSGFQELIYDAQNKLFDTIIIYDITRGSRDIADWFNFRKLMSQFNVNVLSTSEKLGDILDPNDYLTELLAVGIGHRQVLETRKKSIDGKTTKARHGTFQGGFAPLGYDIVNQEYVINQNEANTVKFIFSSYTIGKSYNYIIDKLQDMGVRGKRGQVLGKNSLISILSNDRYIGVYSWNRNINRKMKKWVGLKNANPNKVEIADRIPRLIDDETWAKARERMSNRKNNGSYKAKQNYLLSGVLICDKCGGHYVGHTSTSKKLYKTKYYVCGNKYRNHTCDVHNINADFIETELALQLRAWLTTENIKEYALDVEKGFTSNKKINHIALSEELKTINGKISKAVFLLLENDIDAVKDALLKMQTRKLEIETLLNSEPNNEIVDAEIIYKTMTEDLENINNIDNATLIKRYIREVHILNNEFTVVGGVFDIKKDYLTENQVVFTNGSPSRI